MTLLASNATVLSLAQDEHYVYAGQPWGVAVYDLKGEPVTRVALAQAANALAVANGMSWVGTPKGVFRIETKDWSVGLLSLSNDNGVNALAVDGDSLWIGTYRNVQMLNTSTLELRAFSYDELRHRTSSGCSRTSTP